MSGRRSRQERGNAMLEFALSFGILFPAFLGVFQFGYSYYVYNSLENAVRAGARYASLHTYDSHTSTPSAGYLGAVRNVVICGAPSGEGERVVPGLNAENVSVVVPMERGRPARVEVAITGYRINSITGDFTLNGKPKVTFPYMGRFAP